MIHVIPYFNRRSCLTSPGYPWVSYGFFTPGLTSTAGGRKAQHPSKLTSKSSFETPHKLAKARMTGGRRRMYHMNS